MYRNSRTLATFVVLSGLMAASCNCESTHGKNSWTKPADEEYGQSLPEQETETSEPTTDDENLTPIPTELRERMVVEVKFVAEDVTKRLDIQQGTFALLRQPDGSVTLSVGAYGILDSGHEGNTNWTTTCGVNFFVPWNPDSPPTVPFTWEHTTAGIASTESKAVRESNGTTGPGISTATYIGDDPEPHNVILYPNPPAVDPYNTEISGTTVFEKATGIGWNSEMEIIGHSHIRVKDHVGREIEVNYYVQPLPDGGIK